MGLLGLMLLQESRRAARSAAEGELILLDRQDRSLGIVTRSLKASRSPRVLFARAGSVRTPCKRPSRRFMLKVPRRRPQTGARSRCSTTG